jgi:L-fuculose-phosphate aldolase
MSQHHDFAVDGMGARKDSITETRQRIADIGRLMYERFITDTAGGNISARAGDVVCITPRFSGSRLHWHLRPEQVLVIDTHGNKLDGEGEISREARVHLRLFEEFPDGGAVIHAHPKNVMVFAMSGRPILPVLEGTLKFGTIKVCSFAPAHSPKLAESIVAELRGQEAAVRKQAAAVIAPWHGLFVLGKDLEAAFDAVERIDVAAYCILMSRLLPGTPVDIEALSRTLVDTFANYSKS